MRNIRKAQRGSEYNLRKCRLNLKVVNRPDRSIINKSPEMKKFIYELYAGRAALERHG